MPPARLGALLSHTQWRATETGSTEKYCGCTVRPRNLAQVGSSCGKCHRSYHGSFGTGNRTETQLKAMTIFGKITSNSCHSEFTQEMDTLNATSYTPSISKLLHQGCLCAGALCTHCRQWGLAGANNGNLTGTRTDFGSLGQASGKAIVKHRYPAVAVSAVFEVMFGCQKVKGCSRFRAHVFSRCSLFGI